MSEQEPTLEELVDALQAAVWSDGFHDHDKHYVERGEPSVETVSARQRLLAVLHGKSYLLHAYIEHVGSEEGVTFVKRLRDCNSKSSMGSGPYYLSEEELKVIEELDATPFVLRDPR